MQDSDRRYFFQFHQRKFLMQEWGPKHQTPILFIHGFPGCGDQAKLITSSPIHEKFCLIAMDRPGYGKSDLQPRLTPLSFGRQMKKFLDRSQIQEIRILTVSGGAPYAFALAYLLKDRVKILSSIGGVAPLSRRNFRHMSSKQKKAWMMRNFLPAQALEYIMDRVWKSGIDKIDELLFANLTEYSVPDQKVFSDNSIAAILIESIRTALAPGPAGILHDMHIYSRPWGFPLNRVNCPVTLWHGTEDDVVNVAFAEDMKRQLPNATLKMIEGEGHYSLCANQRDAILDDILI